MFAIMPWKEAAYIHMELISFVTFMVYLNLSLSLLQNTKYNIPVNIWVTDNYPRKPPIVYVTPTSGMIIKPNHSFVSASGTVQSPYLKHHWTSSRSNLVDMAYDMAILFGQDPPLFQKPPGWLQKTESPVSDCVILYFSDILLCFSALFVFPQAAP